MIIAWSMVDLPEPVLPEVRACCEVPLPRMRCWSLVAPARPSGMSTILPLSNVQNWSGFGAMNSNGTSTRLASRAAAPTWWRILRELDLVGRGVQRQRVPAEVRLAPVQLVVLPDHVDAVAARCP